MARRFMLFWFGLALIIGPATISAANRAPASVSGSNAVIDWNANAGKASVAACFLGGNPPQEARMYAMMHAAIHDALNGIDLRSRPYAATLTAHPERRLMRQWP